MHYFFASSYLHLYHALDLQINIGQKVTIITRNLAIEKFCRHISNKVICYNESPGYATFKVHKELKHLIKIKGEAKEFIESINFNMDDTIIHPTKYFHIYQAGRDVYQLKIISNVANIYFADITGNLEFIQTSLKHIENSIQRIRLKYIKLLYYFVYGIKFSFYKLDNKRLVFKKIYLGIKNRNIALTNYNHDNNVVINNVNNSFDKLISEQYDHLIIYDGDGEVEYKFSTSSLEDLYRYLFSNIKNIGIKRTPKIYQGLNNQLNIDIEKNYNCLPAYIPSELLLKNITKSVISIDSATLINASYFKKLQSISLLELVLWKDKNRKIAQKNILIEKGNNILFPKHYDELLEILN